MKIKPIELILYLLLSSCSSSLKSNTRNIPITFNQFEQAKLGQSSSDLIKVLGEPFESSGVQIDYKNQDEYSSQRASFTIDPITKNIISKIFIPTKQEPEATLDYLKNIKYKNIKFTNYEKSQCQSHYPSTYSYLVNFESGLSISYFKGTSFVSGISWQPKDQLIEVIRKLKNCTK